MCKYFFCESPWPLPWKHRSTSTIWIWLSVSHGSKEWNENSIWSPKIQHSRSSLSIMMPQCTHKIVVSPNCIFKLRWKSNNTTSHLQLLKYGIITILKTHCIDHNLWSILDAGEKETFVSINECWKSYSAADYTVNIKESMNVLRFKVLNDCWKKLWPEAVTKLGIPQPAGSNDKHPHVNSLKFEDSHISRRWIFRTFSNLTLLS